MDIPRTLLEITIYSAIIVAAIMLFKKLNREKLSPVLGFMLWFILLARLCVPVTLESGIAMFVVPDMPAAAERQDVAEPAVSTVRTVDKPAPGVREQHNPAQAESAQSETSTVSAANSITIKPENALITIWLAGVALMLIHTLYGAAKLRRVVRRKSVIADMRVMRIYGKCCSGLNICKRLPVRVTQEVGSPALTALFRPAILLPLGFVESAGDAELAFALRHELTHYKRKDHLICLIMRVLEAVYWFNPAVWVAGRQMVLDMESACDSMVVRGMEKMEKTRYANIVLNMFSGERRPRFAVGMALHSTKDVAERRIRGIFMKQKTKIRIKTGALLLAAMLFVACFTTACQPVTQDEAARYAAENADEVEMEIVDAQQAVTETSAPEESGSTAQQQAVNERYTGEKQINDITTLTYGAEVIQPEQVPAGTLSIRDFTSEDVKAFADYFMEDRELYAPWEQNAAELAEELEWLKADLERIKTEAAEFEADTEAFEEGKRIAESEEENYGMDSNNPNYLRYSEILSNGPVVKNYEYYIEKIEEALESAPEETIKEPASFDFADVNHGNVGGMESGVETLTEEDMIFNEVQIWSENADGGVDEIYAMNRPENNGVTPGGTLYYTRNVYRGMSYEDYTGSLKDREALTLPEDEAVALATDAVNALIPDMALQSVELIEDYPVDENGRYNYHTDESVPSYYDLCFTRVIEGVPMTYYRYGSTEYLDDDMETYVISEEVRVTVDNDGISSVNWTSPYTDINITEPDADTISLEQAAEAFERQLADSLAASWVTDAESGGAMDAIEINIDRIQLGLTRIWDGAGNAFVPTWDFFGTAKAFVDGGEQQFNRFGYDDPNQSFGTINALTGETIDRDGLDNFNSW